MVKPVPLGNIGGARARHGPRCSSKARPAVLEQGMVKAGPPRPGDRGLSTVGAAGRATAPLIPFASVESRSPPRPLSRGTGLRHAGCAFDRSPVNGDGPWRRRDDDVRIAGTMAWPPIPY